MPRVLASGRVPVSGRVVASGRLLLPERQNLLLRSEEFNVAPWVPLNATVSADVIAGPALYAGSMGDGLIASAVLTNHRIIQTELTTAIRTGLPQNLSVFAKAGNQGWIAMFFNAGAVGAWFDITTGALGAVSAGVTAAIQDFGAGWWRCSIAGTRTNNGTQLWSAPGNGLVNFTGDGVTVSTYLFGAQFNSSSLAWPYVLTVAAYINTGNLRNAA